MVTVAVDAFASITTPGFKPFEASAIRACASLSPNLYLAVNRITTPASSLGVSGRDTPPSVMVNVKTIVFTSPRYMAMELEGLALIGYCCLIGHGRGHGHIRHRPRLRGDTRPINNGW